MPKQRATLKDLRLEHFWTQAEAAERVGVHYVTWCAWEKGKVMPSLRHIRKLADLFGMAPGAVNELLFDRLRAATAA